MFVESELLPCSVVVACFVETELLGCGVGVAACRETELLSCRVTAGGVEVVFAWLQS